jgi:Ran GTPase-activating protein (RanGAP) involved in mRNA processing and transport
MANVYVSSKEMCGLVYKFLHLRNLKDLTFSGVSISDALVDQLQMYLCRRECHLQRLDLSRNKFSQRQFEALAYTLSVNTSLKELCLSDVVVG